MSHKKMATSTHIGSETDPAIARPLGMKRIRSRVRMTPEGCWQWTGWIHPRGYAYVSYAGVTWRAHRLAYTLWKGPIPPGIIVCHTCDNRRCCNPLHLFLGTIDTNNKDMAAKGRCKYSAPVWPRCKNGHEFTPENTRIDSLGFRQCRECQREHGRRQWRENPEKMRTRLRAYRARRKLKSLQLSEEPSRSA